MAHSDRPAAAASARHARGVFLVSAAAVAVAAILAFAAVLPGSRFVFDDHVLIEDNAYLVRGDVFWAAFARDYFSTSQNPGGSGYYRPIATLTDALDMRVWGKRRVWGFHVTNLVLHAAASIALAAALRALGAAAPAAWLGALAFAVHPSHAESVAFISGRGDVLAGLWTFLALAFAAASCRFATLGFAVAALCAYLSKEAAIVLPLLVAIVWWARPGRDRDPSASSPAGRDRWIVRWIVLGVVSLLAFLMRYAALGRVLPVSAANPAGSGAFWLPLQSAAFALASIYAPQRRLAMEPDPNLLSLVHIGAGALVAAVLWVGAWRVDPASRGFLRRAALATAIAVLPVLNWIPQETRLSERFLYLASGFAVAPFGVLVTALWRRRRVVQPAVALGTALVAVLLAGTSAWRARAWRDDIVLWRIATAEEPERAVFWSRYGLALMQRKMFTESERALERAIATDPREFNAQQYLAMVYHQTDRPSLAITQYGKALELQPRNVYVILNIALARMSIADLKTAYDLAQQALAIDPNHFEALRLAGGLAMQLGLLSESRRYLEAAMRQEPQSPALRQQMEVLVRREAGLESARPPIGTLAPAPAPAPMP